MSLILTVSQIVLLQRAFDGKPLLMDVNTRMSDLKHLVALGLLSQKYDNSPFTPLRWFITDHGREMVETHYSWLDE